MESKILKMERKYAIYLPPDYETSERSYPVLYLLHGAGDDQTGWVQFGEVLHIADKAILEGSATPMIIVMPDGNAKQRGYFNDPKNEWRYEDFFFEEFMPYVEITVSHQRREKVPGHLRPLHGRRRHLYVCPAPPGALLFRLSTQRQLRSPEHGRAGKPQWKATGPGRKERMEKETWYKRHSALELINDMPDDQKKKRKKQVRWYIDCGDDDFLFEGNSLVHIALRKKEIPHEFRIRDGGHTWTYWRESLPEVLSFISDAFHQY